MRETFKWDRDGTFSQTDVQDEINVTFESSQDGTTCWYLLHHPTMTPDLYIATSGSSNDNIEEMTKVKDYYSQNYPQNDEMCQMVSDFVDCFAYYAHVVYLIEVKKEDADS